jgi:hypothetical protein
MSVERQVRRLERWLSKAPPRTRRLGELLIASVIPRIRAAGFEAVGCCFDDATSPVQGGELRFERTVGDHVDVIVVDFDKYASPRVQVAFSRRPRSEVSQFVRSGRLVKRSAQFYCEWGKPRWMPLWLWSERRSAGVVRQIAAGIEPVVRFLDTGLRGPQISRPVARVPGE